MIIEPVPRLGVDGFTDGANDTERAEVCVLHVRLAKATEKTDGGRRGVEVRELVLVDRLPEAGRRRVDGRGLEDSSGDTVSKWAVNQVTVLRFVVSAGRGASRQQTHV